MLQNTFILVWCYFPNSVMPWCQGVKEKQMSSISPINVCTWCSTIQWSGGQMEAWEWNNAWENSSFTCLEDWRLLTDISAVQSACSSLCTVICVYKLDIFCHFHFLCKERKHPKLWPQRLLSWWAQGMHKVWTHALPELAKPSARWRGVGPRVLLLWTSQIWCWCSPLLPNTAIPEYLVVLLEVKCHSFESHRVVNLGCNLRLYIVCGILQTIQSCENEGKYVI